MGRSKPPLARLHELTAGQHADFFVLLAERTKGATREGKPYYTCRFRDQRRTVAFKVWADGGWYDACEQEWHEGQFFKVRGRYFEHERFGPQIEIEQIRPVRDEDQADGFEPAEFLDRSPLDPEVLYRELKGLAEGHIADLPLRRLVLTLLERQEQPLKTLPATQRNFYPFPGGLLQHLLSVTQSCIVLAEKYVVQFPELRPPLNKDLVVAGAILHDIGRVVELAGEPFGIQQTVPGKLVGHLFLGRDLVRDTARELGDVQPELVQLLEHIIISHLNHPEWGSPKLPLIPECLIIHHADDLDAKLEMYVRCLTKDQAAGPFTDRDPVLGRQLYKGRSV